MSSTNTTSAGIQHVRGSCHCGAVRFDARIDLSAGFRCNCSICTKLGAFVASAEADSFTCSAGEEQLAEYEFGPRRLRRFFCRRCGVLCFAKSTTTAVGHSEINVNLNTLEGVELAALPVVYFDGRHDSFDARSTPWPMFPPPQASAR